MGREGLQAVQVASCPIILRASYAMSGTQLAYDATRCPVLRGSLCLSCYALAASCPVLRQRMMLPGRSTGERPSAYDATQCAVLSDRMVLSAVGVCSNQRELNATLAKLQARGITLCACYAVPGADKAYGAGTDQAYWMYQPTRMLRDVRY
eukprot:3940236-Rhodomonas_salina.8